MQTFLKWLAALLIAVILMAFFFALYARFLVDYSLESLESAGRIADRSALSESASSMQVYRRLMQNVLLDEAAQENADFRNLALIQLASRSATEETQGDYRSRYKYYISEVHRNKTSDRGFFLRAGDKFLRWFERIKGYGVYFWSWLRGKAAPARYESTDLTSAVLLSQAEASQKKGDLDRAVSLYEKYLERNQNHADTGYVSITLAGIKVNQRKWQDASLLLKKVTNNNAGYEEAQIAGDLLLRMETLKRQWQELDKTEKELSLETDVARRDQLKFKLSLLNLRLERFGESQTYLKQLGNSSNNELQLKARFYLGWIYKLEQKYDVSAEILKVLADDPRIDEDLRNGIKAELADVYYQKGDANTSLQHYRSIAQAGCEEVQGNEVSGKAWTGLAELEKSFLYYNLGDGVKAGESLGCVVGLAHGDSNIADLKTAAETATGLDLHLEAFSNLQKGRIEEARLLFERGHKADKSNYLNFTGMAMVNILEGKIGEAEKAAREGYKLQKTEYSAAVVGYVLAFQNQIEQAIAYYLQAVEIKPSYFPSRFNLACLYLKTRQYKEALKHLLELERVIPDRETILYSKVLNNLGCALWWLGKETEAIGRLEQAVQVTPGYVDAELNLKQIRLERVPLPVTTPQLIQVEG